MTPVFKLSTADMIKGMVVAGFTGAVTSVQLILDRLIKSQTFAVTKEDLLTVLTVGSLAAIGYLMKQLITDENGKLGGKF